jgi:hypothetical protein
MAKTPSPWKVEMRHPFEGVRYIVVGAHGGAVTGWGNVCQGPEDAALMAAAPEMLEALVDLLYIFSDYPGFDNLAEVNRARAAVTKAKSKPPAEQS